MAFTFDAKTTANATSTGLTVSHTNAAAAKLLVCGIGMRGNPTVSMTYAGAAMTLADQTFYATDPELVSVFYLVAPATGANNLIVTLNSSLLHFVSISSWLVDNTPASLDVTAVSAGDSATIATALTGAVGGLAVDCVSSEQNSSPPFATNGADQTVLHNVGTGSYGIGSSYELNPAANEQFDWTTTNSNTYAHVVACLKEASGAVVLPPRPVVVDAAVGRAASW